MKRYGINPVVLGLSLVTAVQVFAASERGSEEQAQEMVNKAVSLIHAQGSAVAYKTFTDNPGSAFRYKDLFVFVVDFQGTSLANGRQPKMVGKSLIAMRDVDGNLLIKGIIDVVKSRKTGWYGPYKSANPVTKEYERKKTYCEQGDGETAVCVGVFLGK
ncbi:MAG: cache domain-containing protein [Pseudomonadota bacterium]